MKLNKEMKEKFVNRVIAAIPMKNTMTLSKLIAALEIRHHAALPDDIKRFAKKHPHTVRETGTVLRVEHQMIHRVYTTARDPDLGFGNAGGRMTFQYSHITHPETKIETADLVTEFMAHLDERLARDDLRIEMLDKCEPCTTLAKLKDRFPDLVEHMPKETKTALVVITPDKAFVDKLVKAGYPKKEAA